MPILHMETDLVRETGHQLGIMSVSLTQNYKQLLLSIQSLSGSWQGSSRDFFIDEINPILYRLSQLADAGNTLNQRLQREVDEWERVANRLITHFTPENQFVNYQEMRNKLGVNIQERIESLHNDTPLIADDTYLTYEQSLDIVLDPNNRQVIETMAERYGLDPALLAGVIAAEIDFDYDLKDQAMDKVNKLGVPLPGAGPGYGNVHQSSLEKAIEYLNENQISGSDWINKYDFSPQNRASFSGSVEAAAIVTAWYSDLHGNVDSPEDMAVVWGAYRNGILGHSPGEKYGFESIEDFRNHIARGSESLNSEYQMGKNAYVSLPYFEFFQGIFSNGSSAGAY